MLYPFPKEVSSFATGMAAFDTFDMAELLFDDAGCIQNENTAWKVTFYLAIGVSAILSSFYWGLEGLEYKNSPKGRDYVVTLLSLVFNDLLFLVLRCRVMHVQEEVYLNLLFPIKESLSMLCRIGLIFYHCCRQEQPEKKSKYSYKI